MYKEELYQRYDTILNEEELIKHVKQDRLYYPAFHIAPKYGLLNDPNGLVYFNHEYHIFYQYHPNQVAHGMKNWFHLTTKDFINYKEHGIKLFPELDYENYGIFSGTAKVVGDNLHVYYTANYRDPENNYQRKPYQYLAVMNKDYEIIDKRIIVEYQPSYSEHFRDPQILDNNNLLIGAQDLNGIGCLVEVSDNNLRHIRLNNELSNCYMLECPNYLRLDNQDILIVSPQGINNHKYQNINSVVYMNTLLTDNIDADCHLLDYGFDYYAPQVFKDKTRTILIAWLGQAETIYPYDKELGWSQLLSLPRELKFINNKLYQYPIIETNDLILDKQIMYNTFNTTRAYKLTLKMSNNSSLYIGRDNYLNISFIDNYFIFDRSNCDIEIQPNYGDIRKVYINDNELIVDIFVDNSVIEIFINNGEYSLSSRFFIKDLEQVRFDNIDSLNYYEMSNIKYN